MKNLEETSTQQIIHTKFTILMVRKSSQKLILINVDFKRVKGATDILVHLLLQGKIGSIKDTLIF